MSLLVLDPGPQALLEDLGRPGHAHLGVSPSGALDRGALALGNRLLGNDERCAGLELLLGGFTGRFETGGWFAITGAPGRVELGPAEASRLVDAHLPLRAEPGDVLRLGPPQHGVRRYLTVRGGLAAHAVLGSRSRDVLSGLGPPPLVAGDRVPFGPAPTAPIPLLDFLPVPEPEDGPVEVRAHRGPRADWFTAAAVDAFFDVEWRVGSDANRVGARLDAPRIPAHARGVRPQHGPLLERAVVDELPSEPMVAGAVQVPPDGRPTVLLADHPVTGGYPVVAVVASASLDLFAQLRPGQAVRFRHA
ncbi:biotin-dependent carboxyltransferase family protein [Leifsonia sp. AG29]|uniref:5-oxoprolinase subunit C family protein n=1 Tax=Leifsonia sp. AG29 TaxID=2598860 RepID=UPI00131CC670|nr:biotin-dependent carboxyltransferase family protein [Leifsonia sp. AG29]